MIIEVSDFSDDGDDHRYLHCDFAFRKKQLQQIELATVKYTRKNLRNKHFYLNMETLVLFITLFLNSIANAAWVSLTEF